MTPDKSIREIRNSLAIGACVLVGALVVCSLVGCEAHVESAPAKPALTVTQGEQIIDLLRVIQKRTEEMTAVDPSPEPTPAPIDYTPQLEAISTKLAQLLERSVVKKPECNKCHK